DAPRLVARHARSRARRRSGAAHRAAPRSRRGGLRRGAAPQGAVARGARAGLVHAGIAGLASARFFSAGRTRSSASVSPTPPRNAHTSWIITKPERAARTSSAQESAFLLSGVNFQLMIVGAAKLDTAKPTTAPTASSRAVRRTGDAVVFSS